MEIRPYRTQFHILPVLTIIKNKNTLSEQAKITFNSNWNVYYEVNFGWLWWSKTI
jgi:hypothetical protein